MWVCVYMRVAAIEYKLWIYSQIHNNVNVPLQLYEMTDQFMQLFLVLYTKVIFHIFPYNRLLFCTHNFQSQLVRRDRKSGS